MSRIGNAMTGLWVRSLGDRDKAPSAESAFRRQDRISRTPEQDSEERHNRQVGITAVFRKTTN